MKANRRPAPLSVVAVALLATLAASCAEQRVIPPPRPAPAPRPAPPAPPPPRPTALDWRTAPLTPGDWTWGLEGGQSVARFAGGQLVLRCDRAAGAITLLRGGAVATGPEPLTITATAGVRTLSAAPRTDGLAVTLPVRDPVFDAMAFSRGRFVVETPGTSPIIAPSWPEVSRVTEDCR